MGGMTRSFDLWGQRVDLGLYCFFRMDSTVNDFWLRFVDGDYIMVDRLTRVYYGASFLFILSVL